MGQKTQWLTKLQEGKKQAQGLKASIWDYGTNSGGRQHCSKKKKHTWAVHARKDNQWTTVCSLSEGTRLEAR